MQSTVLSLSSSTLLGILLATTGAAWSAPYGTASTPAAAEAAAPIVADSPQTPSTGSSGDTQQGAVGGAQPQSPTPSEVNPALMGDGYGSAGGSADAGAAGDLPRDHRRAVPVECRPSSVHCPEITSSEGSGVITTDSLPIGSAGTLGDSDTVTPSAYPTSPGSGGMGSGATGSPTGPRPGPTTGINR